MADTEPEKRPTTSFEPSEDHKEVATAEIQEPAHSLAGKEAGPMAATPAETLTSNMPPEPTPLSGQGHAYCEVSCLNSSRWREMVLTYSRTQLKLRPKTISHRH
jgi:hypothetical protein